LTRCVCIQADLAGEVVLFSLSLTEKGGKDLLAKQMYTFGVLKASESIHANMTAIQPMKPLLYAPPGQCTSKSTSRHNMYIIHKILRIIRCLVDLRADTGCLWL
jgi:hypothetical protein